MADVDNSQVPPLLNPKDAEPETIEKRNNRLKTENETSQESSFQSVPLDEKEQKTTAKKDKLTTSSQSKTKPTQNDDQKPEKSRWSLQHITFALALFAFLVAAVIAIKVFVEIRRSKKHPKVSHKVLYLTIFVTAFVLFIICLIAGIVMELKKSS